MAMIRKVKQFLSIKSNSSGNSTASSEAKDEIEFVIPEPVITDSEFPAYDAQQHDSFSVILESDKLMHRVTSENSKEVFRLHCTMHSFSTDSVHKIVPKELADEDCLSSNPQYLTRVDQQHFVCRVFVTRNGNYFYQFLRPDQLVRFELASRRDVQQLIQRCEQVNMSDLTLKCKLFDDETCRRYNVWAPSPGTYTRKTFETRYFGYYDMRTIDSYEVIDQKLYDEVIELY